MLGGEPDHAQQVPATRISFRYPNLLVFYWEEHILVMMVSSEMHYKRSLSCFTKKSELKETVFAFQENYHKWDVISMFYVGLDEY